MIYDAERGVRIQREVLAAIEDISWSPIKGIACKAQGAHLIPFTSKLSVISVFQRTLCHSLNSLSSIQLGNEMKFLFSTFSSLGDAIVTELVSRGHEVRWLYGPRFRNRISATCAHFIPWKSPICNNDITPGKPDAGTSGMAASVSLARVIFVDPIVE